MIKRGDTKLVPPNGVCERCGTDLPGGPRHAYQRWSRVKVKVLGETNTIRHFVCCRTCYTQTLPSQGGRTALSKNGALLIYKRSGELRPICRQVKVTRFCVGYTSAKVSFNPRSRRAAMDRYWADAKVSKKRSRHPVELDTPIRIPDPKCITKGTPPPLDILIHSEIDNEMATLVSVDELGEPGDTNDILDFTASVRKPKRQKGLNEQIYWEPYHPIRSNKEAREGKIYMEDSKIHGKGAFVITPLYAGQCIGSYAFDMIPITTKQLAKIPDNRQDYILPIVGEHGEQLFINGEESIDFSPRINHSFESANVRFDSAAQVHCMVDISDASLENPVELKANYGDAYWCHKLLLRDFGALSLEQRHEVSAWLRIVLVDNPCTLSQRQLLCHSAWHEENRYVAIH